MKANLVKLCLLAISTFLLSCSPKFTPGTYTSYSETGMLMAGKTITFFDGANFEYKYWSDDIRSNKKGKGEYRISDNELILDFEDSEPEETKLSVVDINADDDSLKYRFNITDIQNKGLVGAMVELLDIDKKPIRQGITNSNGACELGVSMQNAPASVKASYFGMTGIEIQLIDQNSKHFRIQLPEVVTYIGKETVYNYNFKTRKNILILKKDDGRPERLKRLF